MKKQKIIVAISGGIDSTTTTLITKKCGFFVENLIMKNWEYKKHTQCNKKDINFIKKISKQIKINIYIKDYSKEYWEKIFIPFIKKIKKGEIPNPDIECNKKIKFKSLIYDSIKKCNFDYLATGHYAKITKRNKFNLDLAFDKKKDQSYFLYTLKNKIMKKIIFPLSNYSKIKIKKYIKNENIINYNKKESMGICFIEEKNIKFFLKNFIKKNTGDIIYEKSIIGLHYGAFLYTLGEKKKIKNESLYIYKKNIKKNKIYITKKIEKLKKNIIKIKIKNIKLKKNILCEAKTRHQSLLNLCLIKLYKNQIKIVFKNKQNLIDQGQHIVFYKNNKCIGGYKI